MFQPDRLSAAWNDYMASVHISADRIASGLTHAARLLLGFVYLINGLNWWIKVLPYPSASDPPLSSTPAFVQAMIDTGYMFDGIRVIEVVIGTLLLANRWVPLALVVAFPVTVGIWSVDFFLLSHVARAQVMGWSVLFMNVFLLCGYSHYFKPMLVVRAKPSGMTAERQSEGQPISPMVLLPLGTVAVALGSITTIWLLVMTRSYIGL